MAGSAIKIIANGLPFVPDGSCPIDFGVHKLGDYFIFMVPVPDKAVCELLLYRPGKEEPVAVIPLEEQDALGIIRCVTLRWPKRMKLEYMYRVNGELKPGPYAKVVSDSGRCALEEVTPAKTEPLHIPYNEMVLYKAHVKGLTRGAGSGVRHKGSFTGIVEKIPYLKELGINALLLMPVYEFQEKTKIFSVKDKNAKAAPEMLTNYWGYTEGMYFVPKKSYCATANSTKEFADMVDALHEAGIEVHLDMYFTEGCLPSFAVNVLRYWKTTYKVDGFHLVGNGGWVNAVLADPLLKKTKLFYAGYNEALMEQTDITLWGDKEVKLSSFGIHNAKKPYERNLIEYNRSYSEHMRRFLKGDDWSVPGAAWFYQRNYDPAPCVNFFADQDGYTMFDMVSYQEKHNEENGQNNEDGSWDNNSWNCGIEGPTQKKAINDLRLRQLKNAFLMLLTSQGIPMIYAGDELMNSQYGNNNAWCQDNSVGWVNWMKKKDGVVLQKFVKDILAFRKDHPVLHQVHEITHMDKIGLGIPDLSLHGEKAWFADESPESHMFGQFYYGKYAPKGEDATDCSVYIACNTDWREQTFALPSLGGGEKWRIKIDTDREDSIYPDGEELPATGKHGQSKTIQVAPRSIMILIGN